MLFKLSLKNIRKSVKDYAIYFFTLVLGVAIFYVFNAVGSQTLMLNVSKSSSSILKILNPALSAVSVFVSIILGALIIYANRFLIKRRNKEFGVYLTLGMSKRKMSTLLFFETLLIGIMSLAVGLIMGVAFSQLMSIVVANMFEADMTKFAFTFSQDAFVKTLIYLGIIYWVVILFNTIQVGKCKLIDLMYGTKKGEKLKLKNPLLCTIIFIISCAALGYAYYSVSSLDISRFSNEFTLEIIAIGSVSTFFIFWSLSGLMLKIFSKMKSVYYRGLNSFTLRQFSSKINTMVFSMTIICLMLFTTICLLSSAFALSNSFNNNLKSTLPADVRLYKPWNADEKSSNLYDRALTQEMIDDSRYDVKTTLLNNGFDVNNKFKDTVEVNYYQEDGFTLGTFLEGCQDDYDFGKMVPENIMTISDYNKVAKLYNHKTYELNDDEYIIIADFDNFINLRNMVLKEGKKVTINGKVLKPKYSECEYGFVDLLPLSHDNIGIFIVPNNAVKEDMLQTNNIIANYSANSKAEKESIENELQKINDTIGNKSLMKMHSKIQGTEISIGLGTLVVFLAMYLGLIFLISSAAILTLKELSESADNIERYSILRKIGVDEKVINRTLFKQIGIFFVFPLILATIHSVFGIKFATRILTVIGVADLSKSIMTTMVVIVALWGAYFLMTYFGSKNIIKSKRK